jgi:hypothetical protein
VPESLKNTKSHCETCIERPNRPFCIRRIQAHYLYPPRPVFRFRMNTITITATIPTHTTMIMTIVMTTITK